MIFRAVHGSITQKTALNIIMIYFPAVPCVKVLPVLSVAVDAQEEVTTFGVLSYDRHLCQNICTKFHKYLFRYIVIKCALVESLSWDRSTCTYIKTLSSSE
jgi:hypothetical protein